MPTPLSEWGPVLEARQTLADSIRNYFRGQGYLEVQTPLRIRAPALEDYIDAEPSGAWYLRTSPELQMKRLLAAGFERIFQLGPCFRKGERGPQHLPEFAMLEWYRARTDCYGILRETSELVRHCARQITGNTDIVYQGKTIRLGDDWDIVSVDDAFTRHAGADALDKIVEAGNFETVLVEDVLPRLEPERPTVMHSFPASMSSLARRCENNPGRVERWELFIGGMEIANAYSELTDYHDQLQRFDASRRLREAAGRDVYPVDQEYLQILQDGFPPCGGIAFGVDRFLMLLTNQPTIQDVVLFANDLQ